MDAVLGLQITVGVISFHLYSTALDAGFFAFKQGCDGIFVAVSFTPACVHSHEHGAPVVGLGTAGSGIDCENRSKVVSFVAKHVPELQGLHGFLSLGEGLFKFKGFRGFYSFIFRLIKALFGKIIQHIGILDCFLGLFKVTYPGLEK